MTAQAFWITNKFTNFSSLHIMTAEDTTIKINLFGDTIADQVLSLANVAREYGLECIKTDKEHLALEFALNAIMVDKYNYSKHIKLEEM